MSLYEIGFFFWEGVKAEVCRGCRGKQLESGCNASLFPCCALGQVDGDVHPLAAGLRLAFRVAGQLMHAQDLL